MPYAVRLRRGVGKNVHSFSQLPPEFSTDLFLIKSAKKLLPSDNDGAFSRFQTHTQFARQAAKRGQYQPVSMLPKARQSDAFARSLHSQRRMQMPG